MTVDLHRLKQDNKFKHLNFQVYRRNHKDFLAVNRASFGVPKGEVSPSVQDFLKVS